MRCRISRMKEENNLILFNKLTQYYLVKIVGERFTERPDAEEVYILDWEAADIIIPWSEGRTPKQAILDWAMYTPYPVDDVG